jgi:hypothetical protein
MNFKTTDDLLNFAKEIEKTLTPQEQNVISYHRKNMNLGVTDSKTGRPMTAYMVGPKILQGKYKGMIASVPGFVPGYNNNEAMSEDQAREYWMPEIEKGKWPIYSPDVANKRSMEVHTIMDADTILKNLNRGNQED